MSLNSDQSCESELCGQIVKHLPVAVIFMDMDKRVIITNDSVHNLLRRVFCKDGNDNSESYINEFISLIDKEVDEFMRGTQDKHFLRKSIETHKGRAFFQITMQKIICMDTKKHGIGIVIEDVSENIRLDNILYFDVQLSEALNDLAKSILSISSIDDISAMVLDSAQRFTGSRFGFAGLIDPNTGALIVPTHTRDIWDTCKVADKSIVFKHFTGLWGWVLVNRKPILTNNPSDDPRSSGTPAGHIPINNFLAVPSMVGDKLVGTIAVANSETPYTGMELLCLERIASLYALGIEHKLGQEDIKKKNEELKKANDDLKSIQSQVIQQEKMASIGQLAAGVAHEINNPMGYIISNFGSLKKYLQRFLEFIAIQTEAIEEFAVSAEESKSKAILERVASAKKSLKIDHITDDIADLLKESLDGAERVKKIVADLKGFSRLNEESTMADINKGIESTLNIIWNELKYKADIKKELGEIPTTKCNIGQLNQVFMNLLVNAAQAIEERGVITIRTWCDERSIYCSISDTGCGIEENAMFRLFDPFYTTKEVGKGTGLGLSIAMDIVKKHNGDIKVESKIGQGTTFTVIIPILE